MTCSCSGSQKQLEEWFEQLNMANPALQFKIQFNKTQVDFLDVRLYKKQNRIHSTLFRKNTDRNSLLHYTSCHPPATKRSLPKSQLLRVIRNNTEEGNKIQQLHEMSSRFKMREYPEELISIQRSALDLTSAPHEEKIDQRMTFVTTYTGDKKAITGVFQNHWNILKSDKALPFTHMSTPQLGFRRSRSLRDFLIQTDSVDCYRQSTWLETNKKTGVFRCLGCETCNGLITGSSFTHPHRRQIYRHKHRLTCTTTYIVYLLHCPCGLYYVVKTTDDLRTRMANHRSAIRTALKRGESEQPVPRHFVDRQHRVSDLKYTIIDHIPPLSRGGDRNKLLLQRESRWMYKLETVTPKGLNAFLDWQIFDMANSCKLIHQVDIPLDETPVHKDHSILVSKNSVKDYILFAYRSSKEAMVLSARRGAVVAKLTSQDPVASVQGVAVTKEYFLVIFRYPSLKMHDIVHIELFSAQTFAYIRTVKGCCNDFITKVSVNRQGSHVVAFSQLPNTNTTEIVVWNLETEEHKHIVKFSSVPEGGLCFDLRYCLAFCDGENFLRSWNLASCINDRSLTVNINSGKKTDGIQELITMKNFPRYVVCRSVKPGVITVWNIVKSKCKSSAVRVERGLMENTDIVLIRDMKLFILTDRGMASFTDTPRPIFQTLLTYDLLKKKYIRKQTGLYIIPCPKHEYRILDGGFLLGLSENRDHFVIWNLETGFIQHRLRPQFKDKPSSLNILPDHNVYTGDQHKEVLLRKKKGKETELQTPWEKRNETKTAKKRRLEGKVKQEMEMMQQLLNEKSNSIEQYILSENEKVIVCSYYAHHLCVFSLETMTHLHTLEDSTSMLLLHSAALNYNGTFLVLSNYCDAEKISYVTLWDLQYGLVKKRLKNEPNVCCMAITDEADRIVFGVTIGNKLKVWDPFRRKHKIIPGYESLNLTVESKLQVIEGGSKALLLSGEVSLWDLDNGTLVSVFTPDSKICSLSLATDRKTILVGMSDTPFLITLSIASKDKGNLQSSGTDLFGEESTSSEDEPDDKDQPEKNINAN
ncbi:uncharacterized protein LOC128647464 [Bombina bombina]|uniref:uncharacterized protein LOC128647464 n=1 Tax=Bombina bombina TaxID=8345 RepID=UPI00235A707C|nr:uncharacterized protein LOC128647464 [Bombina bombina]